MAGNYEKAEHKEDVSRLNAKINYFKKGLLSAAFSGMLYPDCFSRAEPFPPSEEAVLFPAAGNLFPGPHPRTDL